MAASSSPSSQPRAAERGFAAESERRIGEAQSRVTSDEDITHAYEKLAATFASGRTKDLAWRRKQLEGVRRLCSERKADVCEALRADLGRPQIESVTGDLAAVIGEVDYALDHLKAWARPEKVSTGILQQPGRSAIVREPKGLVLVMSPWNFPVNLALSPLAAAVSAGNCVLIKPSEVATATEALLLKLIPLYLDPEAVIVVAGAVPESTAILKLRWDHIIYTGNGAVARHVARAAAEHLTPCTMELGGKSPVIVLPGANIPLTVKRTFFGKFFNAGQICIAPDYVMVHKDVEAELLTEMKRILQEWYGKDAATSDSFGRIVNARHFDRIMKLLESSDGEVVAQHGIPDRSSKFIPPTLIRVPGESSAIMQEEIFGPVLPVLSMASVDSMVKHMASREKPLGLYIFGKEGVANDVIARTSAGMVCVNDTIFQSVNPALPFGGVGASGYGRYHGKFGFDEFSHLKAVMYRATWIDLAQRYPPYTKAGERLFEWLMIGPWIPPSVKTGLFVAGVAAVAVLAAAICLSSI